MQRSEEGETRKHWRHGEEKLLRYKAKYSVDRLHVLFSVSSSLFGSLYKVFAQCCFDRLLQLEMAYICSLLALFLMVIEPQVTDAAFSSHDPSQMTSIYECPSPVSLTRP